MAAIDPPVVFPFAEDLSADSAPELARRRAEAPLARVRLPDGQLAWLALRYADVRLVFSDPRFSREAATRPGAPSVSPSAAVPGMLIGLDPPEHTRIRRLVSRAFSVRTIDQKRSRIQEIVDGLVDDLREHGAPADLVSLFSYPLALTVITEILGVPYRDRGQFQQVVAVIMSSSAQHPVDEIRVAIGELVGYLTQLIEHKRARPTDDLLSALITARDEGDKLSEQELLNNAHLILAAGHDTTANQLSNSLVVLFRHPDQLTLLRQHPELIPNAVEVLLRHVQLETTGLVRIATEDVELSGVVIRAGEAVIPSGHVANSDPEIYPDGRRLDLTRTDLVPHLAFGHGPHHCAGAALARLELKIALGTLLARFPTLRLAVPAEQLRWHPGMLMRTLEELPVAW
jgi:nocardicin N-oxygenase